MEYNYQNSGDFPSNSFASSNSYAIPISSFRFLEDTANNNNSTSAEGASFNDSEVLRNTFLVYGSILAATFLLFCYVRRKYPRVYDIRSWVEDLKTPLAQDQYGWFSWIWDLKNISDDDLMQECGLDSLCFLRLLRMGFALSCFSICNAIWLMPLYATAPGDDFTSQITDRVVRLTVAHVGDGSNRLIGTVIAAYFLFGFVMYLIYHDFKWFTEKRHKWLSTNRVQNHSVYVHNVPLEYRTNEKLLKYFRQCFSEQSVLEAKLRIKAPALQKAVKQRDALVTKLQHALNYEQVKHEEPMHREKPCCGSKVDSITVYSNQLKEANETVSKLIDEIDAKLNENDNNDTTTIDQMEQSLQQCDLEGLSLTANDEGSLQMADSLDDTTANDNGDNKNRSLLGKGVKTIKSKTNQGVDVLASTATVAKHLVTETSEGEFYPSGFVTFRTLSVTNAALQMVHNETPFAFQTSGAPRPDDTFWMNVGRTHQNLQLGKLMGLTGTIALCLLWTIPISFIASLSSVDALSAKVPFIADLIERLPFLAPLLEILAPLFVKIVNALLPFFITCLTLLEGPVSGDIVEASNFTKLASFMIIQTFFVSAVSSSLLQSIEGLVENPTSIVNLLAETLPAQSTYFIQIVFVGTVVASAMEILRVIPLVLAFIRRFLPPNLTEEERQTTVFGIRPLADPSEFEHADNTAQIVLNFIVLLVYAVIAPLTVFIQGFCFFYLLIVYKHQFVYIYPIYPDSGGKVWMNFTNILIGCMFIAEITIIGLMALKRSIIAVPLMIPLIVVTALFSAYIHEEHFRVAEFLPSRECLKADLCNAEDSLPKSAYLQDELRVKEKYPDNLTEARATELGLPCPIDEENPLLGDDSLSYFSCEDSNPST